MEENKRKQYAHLYEHHEVEDPQPREEKKNPSGRVAETAIGRWCEKGMQGASPFLS